MVRLELIAIVESLEKEDFQRQKRASCTHDLKKECREGQAAPIEQRFIHSRVAPTDSLEFGSHGFKASSKPILPPCE